MKRGFFLACEGDTDVIFYSKVIAYLQSFEGADSSLMVLKPINACGIGNFQKWVKTKIKSLYIDNPDFSDYNFTIALCRDDDVFRQSNPPVDWLRLSADIATLPRVEKTVTVEAKDCIEDLFLKDYEGICRFLQIDPVRITRGSTGVEKLQNYFKRANRVYMKGNYSRDFVDHLNVPKIMARSCDSLRVLCTLFGFEANCFLCKEASHKVDDAEKEK